MRAPAPMLLAILLAAGCLGSGPGGQPEPPASPRFGEPVAALEGCRANANTACWEPSVAALPDGALVATDFWGATLAVSRDGGATFETAPGPALPPGAPSGADRRDALLHADPEGRLHFVALVAAATPAGAPIFGVQVARSDDAGATWATNALLASPTDPATLAHVPDRPWIVAGEGDVVYFSYTNAARQEAWLARSDDAGATFGPFALAVPFAEHAAASPAGPPVPVGERRLLVPYLAGPPRADAAVSRLRVAISEDGGATWASATVAELDADTAGAAYWPVAVAAGDAARVAWTSASGRVLLAASEDAGATWSAPRSWSGDDETVRVVPWLARAGDRLVAAWYAASASDVGVAFAETSFAATSDPERAWIARSVNETFPPSEFAHGAALADGRVVLVWADGGGAVLVAGEAPSA